MSARPTPCRPAISLRRVRSATAAQGLAVHGHGGALQEADRHVFGRVRRQARIDREHEEVIRRRGVRILEDPALVRDVPDVAVARVDLGGGGGHRDVALGGVGEGVLAAADVPLAPRRDHGQLGREGGVGELEAHLVVALAGAAVGERVGTDGAGELGLTARDERPAHGGAEEVLAAVNGAGAERGPDELLHVLLAQVLDVALVGARGERLLAHAGELVAALADVGGHADDAGVIVLLEPGHDDRGIETAGVGEDDGAHWTDRRCE